MPRPDELDELFHTHPRLKRYAEMFDAQKNRAAASQQKVAWAGLALLAAMVWYWMFRHTGSWNPFTWKGFFGR